MTSEPLTVTSTEELEDFQLPCDSGDGFTAQWIATFRWPCDHEPRFIVCQTHADRYRMPLPKGRVWTCPRCGKSGHVVSVVKL